MSGAEPAQGQLPPCMGTTLRSLGELKQSLLQREDPSGQDPTAGNEASVH